MSNRLIQEEEEKLMNVLKKNRDAIGWNIFYLKRISHVDCLHKIKKEE